MTNNKQQTEINAVEYLSKVNQFAKENNTDKPRQQTAIEWLFDNVYMAHSELSEKLQQAKEMEKERMIGFTNKYINSELWVNCNAIESDSTVEQYYNETYGGGEQ
jgi:hypothetical protein